MRGRRRLLPGLLLLALLMGNRGPAQASTPGELFDQANDAYEKGRYEEAAGKYETILNYGVRDPRVLYNLGNAYFKLGRLGPAILNYERALRIDPSDGDIRDNVELARGRIRDRIPEPEIPYPVQALRQALDSVSSNGMAAAFLLLWLSAAALIALLLTSRDSLRRRLLAYALLACALAVVAAGGGLAYKIREATASQAIVMQDRVDVRSGPGEDNTVLFTVHEGTRVQLHNRLVGWCQVGLPNALSGWVPAASVEQV